MRLFLLTVCMALVIHAGNTENGNEENVKVQPVQKEENAEEQRKEISKREDFLSRHKSQGSIRLGHGFSGQHGSLSSVSADSLHGGLIGVSGVHNKHGLSADNIHEDGPVTGVPIVHNSFDNLSSIFKSSFAMPQIQSFNSVPFVKSSSELPRVQTSIGHAAPNVKTSNGGSQVQTSIIDAESFVTSSLGDPHVQTTITHGAPVVKNHAGIPNAQAPVENVGTFVKSSIGAPHVQTSISHATSTVESSVGVPRVQTPVSHTAPIVNSFVGSPQSIISPASIKHAGSVDEGAVQGGSANFGTIHVSSFDVARGTGAGHEASSGVAGVLNLEPDVGYNHQSPFEPASFLSSGGVKIQDDNDDDDYNFHDISEAKVGGSTGGIQNGGHVAVSSFPSGGVESDLVLDKVYHNPVTSNPSFGGSISTLRGNSVRHFSKGLSNQNAFRGDINGLFEGRLISVRNQNLSPTVHTSVSESVPFVPTTFGAPSDFALVKNVGSVAKTLTGAPIVHTFVSNRDPLVSTSFGAPSISSFVRNTGSFIRNVPSVPIVETSVTNNLAITSQKHLGSGLNIVPGIGGLISHRNYAIQSPNGDVGTVKSSFGKNNHKIGFGIGQEGATRLGMSHKGEFDQTSIGLPLTKNSASKAAPEFFAFTGDSPLKASITQSSPLVSASVGLPFVTKSVTNTGSIDSTKLEYGTIPGAIASEGMQRGFLKHH